MIHRHLRRRAMLTGAAVLAAAAALPLRAQTPSLHVVKDPACGCCTAWIEILQAEGFAVTAEARAGVELARFKLEHGVPETMVSCHTGLIAGYVIEGHVPAADIRRLLAERPDAVGLAVPGMPYGSPGMGPETAREAYDVHLIRRDGSTGRFASYAAA